MVQRHIYVLIIGGIWLTKEKKEEEKKGGGEEEIVLKVEMHCEACARKVARSLRGFQGIIHSSYPLIWFDLISLHSISFFVN